ncbi:MAG: cadmium-translocating P-type ATPase [Ezakiella sp.]|nr:cadmium-translocating P-type ATPase [Ezakiella sp.]MDD7472079.1 cation-translocating P-type ATPase [Bacillota bacterium]MDY3924042.1 cation-translocating P-type ATPase [Ezakiella sp.]
MKEYIIKGNLCPNCARKIEDKLNKNKSVKSAKILFVDRKILIDSVLTKKEIEKIFNLIEPGIELEEIGTALKEDEIFNFCNFEFLSLFISVILIILSLIFKNKYLSIFATLIGGAVIYKNAFSVILGGNALDEKVLIMISTLGALFIGEYTEGAMVIVLYRIGELLTDLAVDRAMKDVRKTASSNDIYIRVLNNDGSTSKILAQNVNIGENLIVEPFEMLGLDSTLQSEIAAIDTSSYTGESEPRYFKKGDIVPGGSIVLQNRAIFEVVRDYNNSLIKRMDDLVKEAEQKKSKEEKFITKFAKVYTPTVVGLAALISIVPWIGGGDLKTALNKSLAFLITSCPCAVVLGVPLSYAVGIGALSRKGILFKGSEYIDALNHVKTIGFDKTGTITENKLYLKSVESLGEYSEADLRKLMAIGEKRSTHPIATAFYMDISEEAESLKEFPGLGIDFTFGAKDYKIRGGSGSLVINLFEDENIIGKFYLEESLKDAAFDVVRDLKILNVKTILISGDRQDKVKALSTTLGFDHYESEMSPKDKLDIMLKQKECGNIAFVGDGINDSAVLEASNVGISMGKMGSDAAINSSDIVIVDDDIRKVPFAVRGARKIVKNAKIILGFSLLVKVGILIAIYLGVQGGMYLAVLGDVGVSIICVLIALLNNRI